jgi:hypothetical protein
MTRIRRHPALSLLTAFVAGSFMFVACVGSNDEANGVDALKAGPCKPKSQIPCVGPMNCHGVRQCLESGTEYGPCICNSAHSPTFGGPMSNDGSDDGATSNDDGATSNDAANDGPTSNDGDDGAMSNDDAATSNDGSGNRPTRQISGGGDAHDDAPNP